MFLFSCIISFGYFISQFFIAKCFSVSQPQILKCLLVDPTDPACCCHAEYKKTSKNEKSYDEASKKIKHGATFILKKIALVNNCKAAFLSAPKRDVIDLQCTCAEVVHGLQQASAVQPCPTGTIREKIHLHQEQRFDITALIKSISACRPAGTGR